MPESTAIELSLKFRTALLLKEREAAVRLVNAYGEIWRNLGDSIIALDNEIAAMVARGEEPVPWRVGKLTRLKQLRVDIQKQVNDYAIIARNEITLSAREAVIVAQQEARLLAQAALPGLGILDARVMAQWQRLNPAAVETLLGFLSPESPLMEGMVERLGPAIAAQVGDKLVEGLALGYNPRKVAQIIRDELGQGLTWSLRTARTVQLQAYRESTRAAYVANPEIVKGYVRRAAQDERTCMACIMLDGKEYLSDITLGEHYNGRCVLIPRTVTYGELGFRNIPEPQFPPTKTGREWFEAQSELTQRQMMGRGVFEAWQEGEIRLDDLIDQQDDPVWGIMPVEKSLKKLLQETA